MSEPLPPHIAELAQQVERKLVAQAADQVKDPATDAHSAQSDAADVEPNGSH